MDISALAYRNLNVPRRLAADFLGVFSAAEFALKHSKFSRGDETGVNPDWDAFAKGIATRFDKVKDAKFREAVDYLINSPPRKQVLVRGHVIWRKSPPPRNLTEAERVLLLVRRVRNNLFHGGKFAPRDVTPERDRLLVKHSLTILRVCLPLHPSVGLAYGF